MTLLNRNWKHSHSLIRHFKLRECIPLYKNVKNRDNSDQKFDLCLKGCLSYETFRAKNFVEDQSCDN